MIDSKMAWLPGNFTIEHAKLALSAIGLLTVVVGVLQLRTANQVAKEATYQRMTKEWSDHLRMFVDKDKIDLRPYFEAKKPLPTNETDRERVLAMADVRLDAIDAILTYASTWWDKKEILSWRNTFRRAFRNSPVLCDRFRETSNNYGLTDDVAAGCAGAAKISK